MLTQRRLKQLLRYDPSTGVWWWRVSRPGVAAGKEAGHLNDKGYWVIGIDGKSYYASRLAFLYTTGKWPRHQIDHRNLNGSDDRWKNLREATQSQNSCNTRRRSNRDTCEYKGVALTSNRRRYQASIKVNGKSIYLGCRATPEKAHELYKAAAIKYHGEFARW
jgi:hypothetical protein